MEDHHHSKNYAFQNSVKQPPCQSNITKTPIKRFSPPVKLTTKQHWWQTITIATSLFKNGYRIQMKEKETTLSKPQYCVETKNFLDLPCCHHDKSCLSQISLISHQWASTNQRTTSWIFFTSPMEHNNDGERVYIGICTVNWKKRLYNHRHSFSNPRLRNQTTQSKYFWSLKDQRVTPQIKWKIVRQSSTMNNFNGWCNLCYEIAEGFRFMPLSLVRMRTFRLSTWVGWV